ncbi:MAG TPA: hypothetical protein VF698_13905 [Thermoanaerobaculia bacterium]|jgi:hypothetical protein
MKRFALLAALLLMTTAAQAQNFFTTTPSHSGDSIFTIGPRLSSYSTDVDLGPSTFETGRQTAFGLVGGYRSGAFVLDFNFDHDPEGGLDVIDLFGFEDYSRDRFEAAVGWSALPVLDLQAGIRLDQISVGGFFSSEVLDPDDVEFQGLAFGGTLHTPQNRPFGVYGTGRYYVGTAEFADSPRGRNEFDATGWRVEGGVSIPLGESNWSVVPGAEYEQLEIETGDFRLDTNRFFINFVWSSGR